MSEPLVIYHGGCRDGFCAAWVAQKAMPGAEFFAGFYGQPPPDVTDREVYIIDFSYQRDVMETIRDQATSLVVLDHHKTAESALAGFSGATVIFDMGRSGAGIAWDYFFGDSRDHSARCRSFNNGIGPMAVRPWIVDYVEDRDLWRHALPDSEAINSWLGTVPFDFASWHEAMKVDLSAVKAGGLAVQAKVKQYVAEVRKNARMVDFEGFAVPLVNAPQVDVSELGHALAEGQAFAMAWWQRADGVFQYSLRSIGDFDVSALAKRHGGGGHKNAAGFQSVNLLF